MMEITLPWPPKELNPNWTGKLRDKLRAKKNYKHDCFYLSQEVLGKHSKWLVQWQGSKVALTVDYFPPDARHRDDDNMVGAFKYGRDMVAQAIGVDDKHFAPVNRFNDPVKGGKVVVTL